MSGGTVAPPSLPGPCCRALPLIAPAPSLQHNRRWRREASDSQDIVITRGRVERFSKSGRRLASPPPDFNVAWLGGGRVTSKMPRLMINNAIKGSGVVGIASGEDGFRLRSCVLLCGKVYLVGMTALPSNSGERGCHSWKNGFGPMGQEVRINQCGVQRNKADQREPSAVSQDATNPDLNRAQSRSQVAETESAWLEQHGSSTCPSSRTMGGPTLAELSPDVIDFGPTLGGFGSVLVDSGAILKDSGPLLVELGRLKDIFGGRRARFGQCRATAGPRTKCGGVWAIRGPELVDIGRTLRDFGPMSADVGQFRPISAECPRLRARFRRYRAKLSRAWAYNLFHSGASLVKFGRTRAMFSVGAEVGPSWPKSDPTSAESGPKIWPSRGKTWSSPGHLWSVLVEIPPDSATAGPNPTASPQAGAKKKSCMVERPFCPPPLPRCGASEL